MPPAEFVEVPNISGLSREEAERALDEAGFFCSHKRQIRDIPGAPVVQSGRVITTNPAPGSQVPPGSQIVIYTKLSGLLALSSALAAAALLVVLGIVLFSVLTPDNIVKEEEKIEEPKAPDESKAVEPGANQRAGGIVVTPTFYREAAQAGSEIFPVEVQNNSPQTQKARFYFVPLAGNSPTGTPEVKVTPKTIAQGKRIVELDKQSATLLSGAQTEVRMKIIRNPGTPEYYGALVVEFGRDDVSRASEEIKGGVRIRVNNIYQITATRILEFGGDRRESGVAEQIRGFQDEEEGGVGFSVRVRNTGNTLDSPDGSVSIFDAEGNLVQTVPLEGSQGIIPGDYREAVLEGRKVFRDLQPGAYTAQADIQMGARESQTRWQFEIDENGELPTPAMRAAARANPYRPGTNQPFSVDVEVLNTGTATYSPVLDMRIVELGQAEALQEQKGEMSEISPGDRARATFNFEGIGEIGNYEFLAEARSNDGTYLGKIVASILVGEEDFQGPSTWDRVRDWMSANPLLTLLLGAAAIILLMAAGIFFWMRQQTRR